MTKNCFPIRVTFTENKELLAQAELAPSKELGS